MLRNNEGRAVVGDYKLVRQLGVANLSRFFLAVHQLKLTTHVVRVLHKGVLDNNRDIRDIFYTELSALRAQDHPSISPLTDILEDGSFVYVVTTHIKGKPLFDQLNSKHSRIALLPEASARRIFHQIVNIALVLERQQVPHWFKLENIIQVSEEKLMLASFRSPEGSDDVQGKLEEVKNMPKHYRSPELEGKNSYTSSGNAWACGVALYALVTGKFPTQTHAPVRDASKRRGPSAISFPTSAQISEDGHHLLHRLLARDFRKRMRLCEIPSHPWFSEGILHANDGSILLDGSWSKLMKATRSNFTTSTHAQGNEGAEEYSRMYGKRSKQRGKSVTFGYQLPAVFRSKKVEFRTSQSTHPNIVSDAELMRSVMREVEQAERVKRHFSFHSATAPPCRKSSFSLNRRRSFAAFSEATSPRERKVRWWSSLRLRSPIAIRRER